MERLYTHCDSIFKKLAFYLTLFRGCFCSSQILQSQLASASTLDSGTLLADEAFDGSGSGDRPIWRKKGKGEDIDNDDEDVHDDRDDEEASGSGMGPTTPGMDAILFIVYRNRRIIPMYTFKQTISITVIKKNHYRRSVALYCTLFVIRNLILCHIKIKITKQKLKLF